MELENETETEKEKEKETETEKESDKEKEKESEKEKVIEKEKESEKVSSVVQETEKEKEKESEKEKEESEKEKEERENVVTYKSRGKKSGILKVKANDKGPDVLRLQDKECEKEGEKPVKKRKLKFTVNEPVKSTAKSSEKLVKTTQPNPKLGLAKADKSTKKPNLKVQKDAGEKNISKRKRGDSSVSDKEVDKGKKKVKDDSGKEDVKEDILPEHVMKQLMKTLIQNSLLKVETDEENESKPDKKVKKKEKLLSEDEIKHRDYLKKLPILQARSAPTALHTAIHGIKNVDIEKFLAEIGFNSFIKFDITKIPSRLGRYVVENFEAETCRLKLERGKSIQVTVNKVHELLGIPIGGESLLSLGTRPVGDDFEKVWLGQFETKSAKQIRVNDIATKLIEAKEVDFLFKVNFLTLFTNTMGMVAGLQGEINLDVVKHLREHTDIRSIDWCEYIFHCLKLSRKPTTLQNKYTGPYTFLALLYLDSTKYEKLSYVRTRPAIKNWSSFLMSKREDMELKEEVMGTLDLYDESELPETEGFVGGCSSRTSYREELLNQLEEKLAVICNERIAFEGLLPIAGSDFPGDSKLIELHKKYVEIFKHPVSLNGEDLDANDDNGDDNGNDKPLSGTQT